MKARNLVAPEIRRAVAKRAKYLDNAGSDEYDTIQLTPEVIEGFKAALPDRHAVIVEPHKEGGGIDKAGSLLKAAAPPQGSNTTMDGAHSFEMTNIDEEVGFRFVMDGGYTNRIARQIGTFYPDSHVQISELKKPELVPMPEGWHLGMCYHTLRLTENKKAQMVPFRHPDAEPYEEDPLGSIIREMVGQKESENITNVAIQTMFKPAPKNWYLGDITSPSVDDAADWLASRQSAGIDLPSGKDIIETFRTERTVFDLLTAESKGETPATEAVRNQRGNIGFMLNIRILAIGQDPEEVVQRLRNTSDMYISYYNSKTEQGFQTNPVSGKELLKLSECAFRREFIDRGMTVGVSGTRGVIHLVNKDSNTENVTFSKTANAGDVPPDQTRFSEWDETEWDRYDRTATQDPDSWMYEITQRQPTEAEMKRAKEIEAAQERGEEV